MTQNDPAERSFDCEFCHGVIKVPHDLEPTKAPCPYCGEEVTSPGPPAEAVVLTPVVDAGPPVKAMARPAPPALAASPSKGSADKSVEAKVEVSPSDQSAKKSKGKSEQNSDGDGKKAVGSGMPAEGPAATAGKAAVDPVRAPEGPSKVGDGFKGETFEDLAKEEKVSPSLTRKKKRVGDSKSQRKVSPLLFLGAGAAVLLIVIGVLFVLSRGNTAKTAGGSKGAGERKEPGARKQEVERESYLREGWKPSASQVLRAFLEAETVEEKAQYVIGGVRRVEDMNEFYRDRDVVEVETPSDAFNHEDLVMADKERGLFLMRFDRPGQLAMKDFFRPVAPLEVQHRVEEPDALLASAAGAENFKMEPLRVLAYFKEEGNELRLDWDVFVQTKYRLMREFLDDPVPGSSGIFRVRLHEDVAPMAGTDPAELRYYRCIDPAHDSDFVKVAVGAASTLGQHLAPLNWVGEQKVGIPSRGATLELEWTDEDEPRVYIKRLICWEYLGLGGVLGNLQLSSGADTAMVSPGP